MKKALSSMIKLGMFMGICLICAGMANSAMADTVFLQGTDQCLPNFNTVNTTALQ
jgi:hypothetical protein